jgi:uncharacterized membrane protein YphA (DoxX/SURF4 family)
MQEEHMNHTLHARIQPLRIALGLMATLAGLDKFFNLLADWPSYISPLAQSLLPLSSAAFMHVVGVIEFGVGLAILGVAPVVGAYAASGWLLIVALNLVLAGHFDVAVRDVVMSIAAFTLAALITPASVANPALPSGRAFA